MANANLRTAVISGNREFRDAVTTVLRDFPELLQVVADVPTPAGRLDAEALELLHEKDPELVLVDFDVDPASALRFVRLLSDARPSRVFVAFGPELSPALLLESMRAGVWEYLTPPADARDLADGVRRVARKLGRGPTGGGPSTARVVAFTGAKGGVGVSTTAVNAAAHAATVLQHRVLLLDLDLDFGAAALLTGVAPRYSVMDLIENLHRLDESLLGSLVSVHESGLHVLPAPTELVEEGKIKPDQLRTILRMLRQHYALTVVDLPRPLAPVGSAVLQQIDDLYFVLERDLPSLRNAKRFLPHVRRLMEAQGEGAVRILLNRFDGEGEIGASEVASAIGSPVSYRLRRDDGGVLHSVNVGHPIVLNGTRSKYRQDVRSLGLELARTVDPEATDEADGGVLTRLATRFRRDPS